ncbi:probable WRKY transcription factor 49 [Amborella trichopoda]|uniref:probable WRKY transcription factor 49 n=1 Tax=Amborella trichopoda TaxID=13333 RepID=UPI0009C050F9|nr:probable WRKY transcription factor 49 [Amborella trichopoda]|eukprot:XP_020524094.1 probable WRKY transcription factor 49 [Amborella trichopoda]
MAESEEMRENWSDGLGEELVRELLDDETPFLLLPNTGPEACLSSFLSRLYSGPTIDEIETALSAARRDDPGSKREDHSALRSTVTLLDKGRNKMDNKYTLSIKSCGNRVADDGYQWRKYGQKSIKNSPHPRSYYRCTNPRCSAKKQVEKSIEDPDTLVITYEGLHLHYAYSHFQLRHPLTYAPPPQPPNQLSKTRHTHFDCKHPIASTDNNNNNSVDPLTHTLAKKIKANPLLETSTLMGDQDKGTSTQDLNDKRAVGNGGGGRRRGGGGGGVELSIAFKHAKGMPFELKGK